MTRAKAHALLALLLLCLAGSRGSAGQVDPRFNGLWSGTESIFGYFVRNQLGGGSTPGRVPALIGIIDSGKTFVVVKGLTPGRYDVSPKSNGNTLMFGLHDSHGPVYGRTDGKITLSADGTTLTETAHAVLPGTPRPINCVITGTFRRQSKK